MLATVSSTQVHFGSPLFFLSVVNQWFDLSTVTQVQGTERICSRWPAFAFRTLLWVSPGLYLTGGGSGGFDHPQEVVDPPESSADLFGGSRPTLTPLNNPRFHFLAKPVYTPLTNLATSMPAIVARSVIASRNSDPPPVKIWQIQPCIPEIYASL